MNERTVTLTYRQVAFLLVLPWLLTIGLYFGYRSELQTVKAAQADDVQAYSEILHRLNMILGVK